MAKKLKLEPRYGRATSSCLLMWALQNSKSFSKMLMSFTAPRGIKLLKIDIFHNLSSFSVKICIINYLHVLSYSIGKQS